MIADRWGVSASEVARRYPCDDLVPHPALAVWRGVSVHTTVARLWPWVAQLRLAPYSYDWIDNLGRRSPDQLRGLPDPVLGEPFTCSFGRPVGKVVSTVAGEQITGTLLGSVLSYVLVPGPEAAAPRTRLLLKIVTLRGRAVAPLISVGDLVMARRQLLNFKRLAEAGR